MALGLTTRFGLTTWSSGDDPFGRVQLQADNVAVDSLAAIFKTGTTGERPLATDTSSSRAFYYNTTTGVLEFSDGTDWVTLNDKAVLGDVVTVHGGTVTNQQGTSSRIARADHTHPVQTATATTITGTNSAGSGQALALADHNHALGSSIVGTTQLAAESVTKAKLNSDVVSASGAITLTTPGLGVAVDGSTVEISSNAIRIKDAGVTSAKINSNVAGVALTKNGSTGALDVNYDTTTLTISSSQLKVNGGITTTSAGSPSTTPAAGFTNVDTSNGIFAYRTSSAWVNTIFAQAGVNGAPTARSIYISNGTTPSAVTGAVGDIWITY